MFQGTPRAIGTVKLVLLLHIDWLLEELVFRHPKVDLALSRPLRLAPVLQAQEERMQRVQTVVLKKLSG